MFNSVTAVGRLGNDPELRYTPSGDPVCNFSLATDVGFGDNKETTWFKITAWRKTAESVNQYLQKGSKVLIVGPLTVEEYTANNGDKRTSLKVNAREVRFLDSAGENQQAQRQQQPVPTVTPAAEDPDNLPW